MKLTPFYLAVILCVVTSCSAAERKWTDNSGRFSVTAELVSVADGKVILKRSDGSTVTLPVSRLIKADQEFLRSTLATKKDSKKENRKSDLEKIQGIWMIEATWIDGNKHFKRHANCFRFDKDTMQAGGYGGGVEFVGTAFPRKFTLDETKTPKRFDKYSLYSLDGDKLVLCMHAQRELPKSIPKEGKKGDNLHLYVLTRAKAGPPEPERGEPRRPSFQSGPATPRGKFGGRPGATPKPGAQIAKKQAIARIQALNGSSVEDRDVRGLKVRLWYPVIIDDQLKQLKGLSNIYSLDLQFCKVTGAGLEHLKGLTGLRVLYLDYSQVTDAGLEHLKGMTDLQTLSLRETGITDAALEHLKELTGLVDLNLRDTKVTDAGLEHLRGLKNLHTLNLDGTNVTDDGVKRAALVTARNAGRKNTSKDNLKDIGSAINQYALRSDGKLPSGKKKPLLSWRVHLLPYFSHRALHDRFHFDEPWDSEHNKKLIKEMPARYAAPTSNVADEGKTVYLAVTGKDTAFERGVCDGNNRTIIIVEVNDKKAAIWTKPDDWEFQPDKPLDGLMGQHPGVFLALYAGGYVHEIPPSVDQKSFRQLIFCNVRKPFDLIDIGR